jgi:hypothetical protein
VEVEVDTPGHLCPWSAVSELRANCSHVDVSLVGGEGGLVGFFKAIVQRANRTGASLRTKRGASLGTWTPGHRHPLLRHCRNA